MCVRVYLLLSGLCCLFQPRDESPQQFSSSATLRRFTTSAHLHQATEIASTQPKQRPPLGAACFATSRLHCAISYKLSAGISNYIEATIRNICATHNLSIHTHSRTVFVCRRCVVQAAPAVITRVTQSCPL